MVTEHTQKCSPDQQSVIKHFLSMFHFFLTGMNISKLNSIQQMLELNVVEWMQLLLIPMVPVF